MSDLSSQVLNLEEQRNNFKKKCDDLQTLLKTKNDIINKLKLSLRIEKFKSNLFSQIITQNTTLNIQDLYKETEEGIHISNFPNGNIPVIVHDLLDAKDVKTYNITSKKKPGGEHGKNFRTVKQHVELVDENPVQLEQKIKEGEEALEEIVEENNLDVSYKKTTELIDTMFEEIDKSRVYRKSLINMKETRSKLLGQLTLSDYTKLLKTHITRLEVILTKKKYDQKKIVSTISLSLSSLDQRLASYGNYFSTELDSDDIQRLKICLKVNMNHPKRYVPFSQTELIPKIANYSLCVSTMRETMKRILNNPYGFPNLVYLHLEKSNREDPYSFYSLEKIDPDGKRCWKMECRLEEFSRFISEQIKNYCILLFRKIYFDIFSDNIYREDYAEKTPVTQQDCEQLLINIIQLSKNKTFCNTLRSIVCKYCTIQPSVLDKFNFTRDDPIVKKSFSQEENTSDSLTVVMKRLFDEISTEDAESIWHKRIE
jgi:hypothetical protein